jgi:hypothetical protein
MMDGAYPMRATHVRLRTESSGYVELPFMLWRRASVCPTSCATVDCTSAP